MAIEDLLDEAGGFGRFQVFLMIALYSPVCAVAWSMLQMAFAGLVPDWYCMAPNETTPQNGTLNACSVNSSVTGSGVTNCAKYHFTGSSLTIINEWDLVCDMKWVKATVTSVQMAGVLVGAFTSGQMGDAIGRKKTYYLFILEHSILNIIAAFSVNWEMFAVCRFFIGIGIGAILVVSFPYSMEFLPTKWRSILVCLPQWVIGIGLFAIAALVFDNWSHVHLACAALGLPVLVGYFFIPESLRFLTVKGRLKEAEEVVAQIARVNRKPTPAKTTDTLQSVYEDERMSQEANRKYTYIDLFRPWQTAKITLIFCFHWCSLSCIYYGISFGVSSLAGNIYLNIFLLALVEQPMLFTLYYFNNKIGRKWTTFGNLCIGCVAAVGCPVMELYGPENLTGGVVTGLSLASKMGVGSAWSVTSLWLSELTPTVTRNLGYGAANTSARVGGIIAPFLIDFDNRQLVSYAIIGCLLLADILLVLITPETKGTLLPDRLNAASGKGDKNVLANGEKQQNGDTCIDNLNVTNSISTSDNTPL